MKLKLYNTRTRRKELFRPIDPKAVRMYVCGPTVYDFAHIGNARPVIVFDVLFRLLRHIYGAEHVIYARNITDVDDKINARAAAEGVSIRELTERTAAQFHADAAAIGALPPTIEPRATEHIAEMIALVERLVERGHAYAAEGHVLFNVPSDDDYGGLSRRSVDDMRAGARVEVAPYKRDPMDFVLWKPSEGAEPGWESPWGFGRPGWHLECSAMAEKHLGTVFDIHGGGIDLLFPHHENELAQSTCAHDTEVMANYWVHNGHLQVEGQKMSKSLGNFITIRDLLKDWPGDVIRLNMLRTHYRQPMDWTAKGLAESDQMLRRWRTNLSHEASEDDLDSKDFAELEFFRRDLADDLNTPMAIAEIHKMGPSGRKFALDLLGLGEPAEDPRLMAVDETGIEARITARLAARKSKNWAEADRIRDELAAMGVALMDAKNPATGEIETTWEIAR
ncbi:cysteinyl-tRNA synthetase [Rhodomicrobium vannielii ATCC 17100]|uniref:Cysteine--tRNA ligase n=1 Tax=Rhodomicrobium vannielii (strain ATCC 17100 / DSM 162 / LMG 4299 / NCIMB 10020 / ATH 3.1.1) TaxID=648757 RepID=E3I8L1_RHOVT|nr:cysteine--tRNA ligase [Rhodomicrobium vannielii]ADP70920.1 cysteinyl-tRNA synthetase [Rhodomicrobium vannielii ATCC 17100]